MTRFAGGTGGDRQVLEKLRGRPFGTNGAHTVFYRTRSSASIRTCCGGQVRRRGSPAIHACRHMPGDAVWQQCAEHDRQAGGDEHHHRPGFRRHERSQSRLKARIPPPPGGSAAREARRARGDRYKRCRAAARREGRPPRGAAQRRSRKRGGIMQARSCARPSGRPRRAKLAARLALASVIGNPDRPVHAIGSLSAIGAWASDVLRCDGPCRTARGNRGFRGDRGGGRGGRSPRADQTLIAVADVRAAFIDCVEFLLPGSARPADPAPGVHPSAVVDDSATLSRSAAIGAGARIGARTRIGPGAVVYEDPSRSAAIA